MPDLATATATSVDWVARGLGIGGLATSVISILVTVALWRREGWKLITRISTISGIDPAIYTVEVTNIGRLSGVMTAVSVEFTNSQPRPPRPFHFGTDQRFNVVLQTRPRDQSRIIAPSETVEFKFELAKSQQSLLPYRYWFRAVVVISGRKKGTIWREGDKGYWERYESGNK